MGKIVFEDDTYGAVYYLLPRQAPVAVTVPGQPHAATARQRQGRDAGNGLFALPELYP